MLITDLVDKYTDAIKQADINGYNDSNLNKSVPGLTIISTPIKPINIAEVRNIPILSPNIGTARKAAIIGAEWAIAMFSDSIKLFIP